MLSGCNLHEQGLTALVVCCRLIGVDAYSFDQKLYHIAQHVQLPEAPKLGPDHSQLPAEQQLPPFLILNIQLPTYKVSFPSPLQLTTSTN